MSLLSQWIGGLGSRVLLVVLTLSAAQFPLYYLAYSNAVAGARVESQARYLQLQQEAAQVQLSVEAFVQKHETDGEAAFRASGRIHRTTLEHYRRYQAMESALQNATLWQRPWVLAQNFDPALHATTRFQPGLPLTAEGAGYALGGLLLAWMLSALTGALFRRRG